MNIDLEKDRQLSIARLKSEARLRTLEDRYWSPTRSIWVYNNPLRDSLARENERERLRESLVYDRSVKKGSGLNSTAAKTTKSSYLGESITKSRSKSH